MKKYVLSALMCLAYYTGAIASNAVIKNEFISTHEKKSNEFETLNFNPLNIKSEIPNCFASMKVIGSNGETFVINFSTRTDGAGPCKERANKFKRDFEEVGFEIIDYDYIYHE